MSITTLKNPPLVSVLMPNYNCERYLSEAIESILNQTYKHFELIIVDDCSIDNSFEIIRNYAKKDSRIKYYRNNQNLGRPKTRNILFEKMSATAKYFANMDSDDISHKERLENQVLFLECNPEFIGCGVGIRYFWENSKYSMDRMYENDYNKLEKSILIKNPFPNPFMFINTCVINQVGIYNEKYSVCEDWDFWIRILQKHKMINIKKILGYYRMAEGQSKSKNLRQTLVLGIRIKIRYMKIKDYFNFNVLLRLFAEIILLTFPKKLVLLLFYKSLSSKKRNGE